MNQYEKSLKQYQSAVEGITDMELKGKTMPYTSVNGHMFSQLNKDGELGVRLSKSDRESFYKEHGEKPFISYGSIMKEYVKIPHSISSNKKKLTMYLLLAYQYVITLKQK